MIVTLLKLFIPSTIMVLKANKSDTCVANTSNATPNTQKNRAENADMGRILKHMRKATT